MQRLLESTKRGVKCLTDVLAEAFFLSPTKPFEVLFALLLIVSGIVTLNWTYDIYGSSKTFRYIEWLPEAYFGALLVFVGANKILAICTKNYLHRVITSGATAVLLSLMFVLFYSANPTGMLIPWIGIIGLVASIIFVRILSEDHGVV
jgi:peptidoglycan/LPS O-acetylase OafA/YrhL